MDLATRTGTVPANIALRPTVVATVVESGAVLLDLDSKYFYELNDSAWAIAQLFETGSAPTQAIVERATSWGLDESDVRGALGELVMFNLVDETPDSGTLPDVTPGDCNEPPAIIRHSDPLQTIVTSAFDPSIPLAE